MIINHNTSAINASRNNSINATNLSKTQEKLSSGHRINRASDDAAGMGVAGKINAQIRGLSQASRNTSKAINFIQTTEGNLNEVEKVLVRMKELAVQSGNGTYSDADRGSIQIEIEQLTDEINRIADQAQYNQMHMLSNKSAAQNVKTAEELGMQPAKINTPASLSGSQASWTLRVHVGANQDEAIAVNIYASNVANLFAGEGAPAQEIGQQEEGQAAPAPAAAPAQGGVNSPINVTTAVDANMSLAKIEGAIRMVSDQRANLGAFQNRLESIKGSTEYAIENLKASYAQIKDATMTDEVVASTTHSILTQSAMAMIAQANQVPQYVLSLLR
ncbi:Flagellin [Borrelia hermsii YBT]|uniref:Flagellin n=2 Tax=Borrelia TaxID=138 RepID=D3VV85_BORHE|nr:flagellin [Borrelia hermsii]ADD63784.1 flagellin [Borrelia hermsii]ADD63788.1 flagellin [Borrelia hermsii]AHH12165.1 Flagellin [Borrelia hermsii YBT]APC94032.1 flagellin [Borrelia hermsii]APC94033.1 flagellin [Borrelia hermsii]